MLVVSERVSVLGTTFEHANSLSINQLRQNYLCVCARARRFQSTAMLHIVIIGCLVSNTENLAYNVYCNMFSSKFTSKYLLQFLAE